jgi:hypothetical protein
MLGGRVECREHARIEFSAGAPLTPPLLMNYTAVKAVTAKL